MPQSNFIRSYFREDFTSLAGAIPIALLGNHLAALSLSIPVLDVRLFPLGNGVVVELGGFPTALDVTTLDNAVAAFVGGATTSQPFIFESFAVSTSNSGTPVVKINQTTPPLDEGTYQVSWASSIRMQSVIANTGVQADITLTSSGGGSVHQDDAWNLANRHAYNGSQPFEIAAGQTITALLTFNRLGASGVAEMSGARITIDKIS